MEKISDFVKKIASWQIIAFSAFFLVALFLLCGFWGYAAENISRSNETLVQSRMTVSDFQQISMKADGDRLISTDSDPQLIWQADQKITNIKFYMEPSLYPGEIVVYYTTKDGEGFSENKRLWAHPVDGENNWYVAELGLKDVRGLRIDPTMYAGNHMTFGTFVINEERTLSDYIAPDARRIFNLLLYTGIISSVLKFVQEIFTKKFE